MHYLETVSEKSTKNPFTKVIPLLLLLLFFAISLLISFKVTFNNFPDCWAYNNISYIYFSVKLRIIPFDIYVDFNCEPCVRRKKMQTTTTTTKKKIANNVFSFWLCVCVCFFLFFSLQLELSVCFHCDVRARMAKGKHMPMDSVWLQKINYSSRLYKRPILFLRNKEFHEKLKHTPDLVLENKGGTSNNNK